MICVQPWKQSVTSSGEVNEMTSEVLPCKEGCGLMRSYMNSCVVP